MICITCKKEIEYLAPYFQVEGGVECYDCHRNTSNLKKYVLGFLIWYGKVVLIRKDHPDWQKGLLNGVGGHINSGETPQEAMRREFLEEAGLDIDSWEQFAFMHGLKSEGSIWDWECSCFYAADDRIESVTSKTSEVVGVYQMSDLNERELIDNILFLIAMIGSQQRSGFIYEIIYRKSERQEPYALGSGPREALL